MTTLISIDVDCFDYILNWCNAHQICKMFWCGNVQLDRLLKTRPLDLKIILAENQQWPISNWITQSNLIGLDVQNDDVDFYLKEIFKLPKSLRRLSLYRNYECVKNYFDLEATAKLLLDCNISKSFPLIQSLNLQFKQPNLMPPQFLSNIGNTMVHLNLNHNKVLLEHVQYLPRSITFLKCLVPTRDKDLQIEDPQFPPNLSTVSLGRKITNEDHMTSAYLDCLILNLPAFIQNLDFAIIAKFTKTFQYTLVFDKFTALTSLSLSKRNSKSISFALPLPIPTSATNVRYDMSHWYNDNPIYPFDGEPRANLQKLYISGFELQHDHLHLLPRNLQVLDWENRLDVTSETFKLLPPKLQYFKELDINGKGMADTFLTDVQELSCFQSQKFLNIISMPSSFLTNLPCQLVDLSILAPFQYDRSEWFGFYPYTKHVHLKHLFISTLLFNVPSLQNLSAPLVRLNLVSRADISEIPFGAPCLSQLSHLELCMSFSKKSSVDSASSFEAFRDCTKLLKTLKLRLSSAERYPEDTCPTWFFAYLPRGLLELSIDHISWEKDLITDLHALPKTLEVLLISAKIYSLSSLCTINVDCMDNLLPNLKCLTMDKPYYFNAILFDAYKNFITKLSSRRHLELWPTLASL